MRSRRAFAGLAGLAACAAAALFLSSIGSRYFVGEYSATVGGLPELLYVTLADALVLAMVGICALWPGRIGRVGVAMTVPVCLGVASGRYSVWLGVVRDEVERSTLGSAFRMQLRARAVAGAAGAAAVVAVVLLGRRRHGLDGWARAASLVGVVGIGCYALGTAGD